LLRRGERHEAAEVRVGVDETKTPGSGRRTLSRCRTVRLKPKPGLSGPPAVESSMVERNQSIWSQFAGQLFTGKQFINCEDIGCHLVEFDV
jgi:hypothetical protein